MPPDLIFVVMGGEIVLAAYRRSDLAHRHARCITGTTVVPLDVSMVQPELLALVESEILHQLPESIIEDINTEGWDDDDNTPEVVAVDDLTVDDLDDSSEKG